MSSHQIYEESKNRIYQEDEKMNLKSDEIDKLLNGKYYQSRINERAYYMSLNKEGISDEDRYFRAYNIEKKILSNSCTINDNLDAVCNICHCRNGYINPDYLPDDFIVCEQCFCDGNDEKCHDIFEKIIKSFSKNIKYMNECNKSIKNTKTKNVITDENSVLCN